ncbi:MAG: UDP-N-acetylglucosamine--N-acetylmuramyl-(pentapeptide) pyrophosphoryl-undecaprenol N-acetylglucosamine transferase [Treponema sp.]|nr:UDP-N-acetylglucosamine--N-acetylmuramyl-(pentapeptide) pyrophosphoryl-undecaprenol N-acetylglucosamine transferase [Treponema sp.]
MVNIAFTGGGTGGHIYPGLAVAAELKKLLTARNAGLEFRIFWIGSSAGMDRSLVEEAGIEFFGVPSGKLRRYFSLRTIVDFFKVICGYFAAKKILRKQKACLLFSKGGFVSVPPCIAAASLKIPVYTHESDFSPGLATKINARYAGLTKGKIFTAYKDTIKYFPENIRSAVLLSGNPIRSIFSGADPKKGREFLKVADNERILLVLGGSQGAVEINTLIKAALPELISIYTVVHQTGSANEWDVPESSKYKPFPYIKEEMPHVMAAAEIVMGRSGAGIWEWAFLGKPMILIPLTGSGTRGDQIENAGYFQKEEAALVLISPDPQTLVTVINSLADDCRKREVMGAASAKLGKNNGAEIIANVLLEGIK